MITRIVEKTTIKEMYDAFVGLYYISNVSRKMLLRNKISMVHMNNENTMVSDLTRIIE
jgi:hypothetical protein